MQHEAFLETLKELLFVYEVSERKDAIGVAHEQRQTVAFRMVCQKEMMSFVSAEREDLLYQQIRYREHAITVIGISCIIADSMYQLPKQTFSRLQKHASLERCFYKAILKLTKIAQSLLSVIVYLPTCRKSAVLLHRRLTSKIAVC